MRKRLLLASHNAGKCREFQKAFEALSEIELLSYASLSSSPPAPEETGQTYAENALLKARFAAEETGLASLADDSGFEVEALDFRPGLHSARYGSPDKSDSDRCKLLLEEMKGESHRRARFVCSLALVIPKSRKEFLFHGQVEGELLLKASGTQVSRVYLIFAMSCSICVLSGADPSRLR